MARIGRHVITAMSVAVFICATTGCPSSDYRVHKPSATEEDFQRDQLACRRTMGLGSDRFDPTQAIAMVIPRYKKEMLACLRNKGWETQP